MNIFPSQISIPFVSRRGFYDEYEMVENFQLLSSLCDAFLLFFFLASVMDVAWKKERKKERFSFAKDDIFRIINSRSGSKPFSENVWLKSSGN